MDFDKSFKNRIFYELEIPPLTAKACARMEIFSNCRANIEGCLGIIEYSNEKILLNLGNSCAKFSGSCLQISAYDGDCVTITGTFCAIDFS